LAHNWAEYIVADYMKFLWLAERMETFKIRATSARKEK
jgi:hypothetical protein